jgi:hypothetical protein
MLLTPFPLSLVLVTPICLLLTILLHLILLVLVLLGRRTKSLVHGLIGRQLGGLLKRHLLRSHLLGSYQNLH